LWRAILRCRALARSRRLRGRALRPRRLRRKCGRVLASAHFAERTWRDWSILSLGRALCGLGRRAWCAGRSLRRWSRCLRRFAATRRAACAGSALLLLALLL
jgi:hypothetical protein